MYLQLDLIAVAAPDVPEAVTTGFRIANELLTAQEYIPAAAQVIVTCSQVHPFDNGNGRVMRLLANIMLEAFGQHSVSFQDEDGLRQACHSQDDCAQILQQNVLSGDTLDVSEEVHQAIAAASEDPSANLDDITSVFWLLFDNLQMKLGGSQ